MGLASSVAFMPTLSISGGSLPPMENSPPGIQTMPSGAGAGAPAVFAMVGWKRGRGAVELTGATDRLGLGERMRPATAIRATAVVIATNTVRRGIARLCIREGDRTVRALLGTLLIMVRRAGKKGAT